MTTLDLGVRVLQSRAGATPGKANTSSEPLPEGARLNLARHRLLPLANDDVAVIAERSLGWCVMSRPGYDYLRGYLGGVAVSLAGAPERAAELRALWNSGLLTADGKPHPVTVRELQSAPQELMLKMTGACNYACTYCYDYDIKRFRARLDVERAEEVIAGILSNAPTLDIAFHGGEPLLRLQAIRKVVDFVVQSGWRSRVRFFVTTNASLLNRDTRTFLGEHDFKVGISCDGMTREANALRPARRAPSPEQVLSQLLDDDPDFMHRRVHILTVASQTSSPAIPEFALWLQEQGIRQFKTLFLFTGGRSDGRLSSEGLTPAKAVTLFRTMIGLIRAGTLGKLNYDTLVERMAHLHYLAPFQDCLHGQCIAAGPYLTVDADGSLRSCELQYHPLFELGSPTDPIPPLRHPMRMAIAQRSDNLRDGETACSRCALFGLCGGTCAALAIAEHGKTDSTSSLECAVAKFIYPEILQEFADRGATPLLDYYHRHSGASNSVSSIPNE